MSFTALLAIGTGATLGAWLRWLLGMALNPLWPQLPLGTLAANLLGGLIMGMTLGIMAHYPMVPAYLKLFITTGFLGALTTFSTFSAEAIDLLLRQRYAWLISHISMHLVGTLVATLIGLYIIHLVWHA